MPELFVFWKPRPTFIVWSVLLLWVVVALAGCRKGGEVSPLQTNLGWLGSLYGMYISQNGGKAPRSIDDLEAYAARKATPQRLAALGVSSVEELFKSPRDGKAYELVVYAKLPPPGTSPPPIVLYEVDGKDGQHAVAYLGGTTDTLDQATLTQQLPAKR